jgi:hypothetical protein
VSPEAAQPGKLKRYGFGRPVIAAAAHNRRIVAVVADRDHVRVRVIGKPLGRLQGVAVPRSLLGLEGEPDHDDLPPVLLDAGGVVTRVGEQWWRLSPEGATPMDYLAVGPGSLSRTTRSTWPGARPPRGSAAGATRARSPRDSSEATGCTP